MRPGMPHQRGPISGVKGESCRRRMRAPKTRPGNWEMTSGYLKRHMRTSKSQVGTETHGRAFSGGLPYLTSSPYYSSTTAGRSVRWRR